MNQFRNSLHSVGAFLSSPGRTAGKYRHQFRLMPWFVHALADDAKTPITPIQQVRELGHAGSSSALRWCH
jgi:hypothetical protein